jgi:2-polyprenyl-3-methyl-5-hydroxy-6-metoxy-1,4-benzoquinol methylase
MPDPYKSILPLVKLKSSLADHEKFHREVNKTFHNIEAVYYDAIHREMWQNLPAQINLLISDLSAHQSAIGSGPLSLLDIGCGTGLATDLLLQTPVAKQIDRITLLDTSSVMLSYALKRSRSWKREVRTFEGEIAELDGQFDLIIISSVLHHIPDLGSFLNAVTAKLNKGGILLTIHDPLQEAIAGDMYKSRCREYQQVNNGRRRNIFSRVCRALKRRLFAVSDPDYIGQTNARLLENGIIHTPLTEVEMWSVTDIHVEGLPYASQAGISMAWLREQLPAFQLVNYRTYTFFGLMQYQLNKTYRLKEARLVLSGDKYGRNFGSVWIKKQNEQ